MPTDKFSEEELVLLKEMGWEFMPTGPNEWDWLLFDPDGKLLARAGSERWLGDIEAIDIIVEGRSRRRQGIGGFTDGNGTLVLAGDRVEYRFEDHRRGVLDEALQDGDAFVTWDDGAKGTVKWCHLAKIPVRDVQPPAVWAPTLEFRWYKQIGEAPYFVSFDPVLQQKFIRTRGGPACGGGSSEWRNVPLVRS